MNSELFSASASMGSSFALARALALDSSVTMSLLPRSITTPFAIQEMTLSVALLGTDLIGQARTGTGKTLAFGIPVLQRSVAPKDQRSICA